MAYGDGTLLVNGSEKGSLVVDAEGKDAVLVGAGEGRGIEGGVGGCGQRGEGQSVEGREHAEFELEYVGVRWREGA